MKNIMIDEIEPEEIPFTNLESLTSEDADALNVDDRLEYFIQTGRQCVRKYSVIRDFMNLLVQGYEVEVFADRMIKVPNPRYQPDDGSNPFILFDCHKMELV